MIVYSGTASESLASKVAAELCARRGDLALDRFPDGEIYARASPPFSDIEDSHCVVVKSTPKNEDLVELLIILDLLSDLGASRLTAVVPYLGYARQDKRFKEGEALSAKTTLKAIRSFCDEIISVNTHFSNGGGTIDFHGVEIRNIDAFPLIAGYYRDRLENPVVIAPDKGSLECARKAAAIIGCEFDYLKKTRLGGDSVEIETKELHVEGKDTVILDDMISTGGTIIEAARVLRSQGAGTVNVGCVHGVFSRGAGRVSECVDELICTDTLKQGDEDMVKVSVAGLVAESLRTTP